jgi:hypothetical protein
MQNIKLLFQEVSINKELLYLKFVIHNKYSRAQQIWNFLTDKSRPVLYTHRSFYYLLPPY